MTNPIGLLRYCARPPFALERINQQPDGNLIYQLNKPLANGQTQLKLTSLELIDKLAALVRSYAMHSSLLVLRMENKV